MAMQAVCYAHSSMWSSSAAALHQLKWSSIRSQPSFQLHIYFPSVGMAQHQLQPVQAGETNTDSRN